MYPRRFLITLLSVFTAGACGWEPPRDGIGSTEIEIVEQHDTDAWRVSYRFPKPIDSVVFLRDVDPRRAGRWQLTSAGDWAEVGEHEAVVFDEPQDSLTLEFESRYDVAGDYTPNFAFSDGSRLLYTGQLGIEAGDGPFELVWRLRSTARGIRVLDLAGHGELVWKQPSSLDPSNGTYAYFGDLPAIETRRMIAVIDPGLPDWAESHVSKMLPSLFDYYAAKLGVELESRPLVLVSRLAQETPGVPSGGRTSKGGTLDGLIQLALGEPGWQEDDPTARADLAKFLSHEAFHMWNGQTVRRRLGRSDRWLSEGSADFFAFKTLFELELTDRQAFDRAIAGAAERCLASRSGRALVDPDAPADVFYGCGAAALFVADLTVQRETAGHADLFDVFADMFRNAMSADQNYDRKDLFHSLRHRVGDNETLDALERWIEEPGGDDWPLHDLLRSTKALGRQ